jgi:hypothetical protein
LIVIAENDNSPAGRTNGYMIDGWNTQCSAIREVNGKRDEGRGVNQFANIGHKAVKTLDSEVLQRKILDALKTETYFGQITFLFCLFRANNFYGVLTQGAARKLALSWAKIFCAYSAMCRDLRLQ